MNGWNAHILLWQFPASLILGAAFLLITWASHHYYGTSRICRMLGGGAAAIVLLLLTAAAVAAEGTWTAGICRTYPFFILLLLLQANLGLTLLRRLSQRNAGFLLTHAGLFILLWAATFGAPDVTKARMVIHPDEPLRTARTLEGELLPLPFEVRLAHFEVEYYNDGITPRQYRSELLFDGKPHALAVNDPAHYGGYTIYQEGYDPVHGAYSVLLLVRDPWLWVVWLGMSLLAAGSLTYIFRRK